ncbi:hypothetical protein [Saccharopolyspora gregorii]|uniref:Uncharacterized protein n=1 Tax=Saccharopolyspora gregorii TaxID=33914 RepID=A0ABP6S388_9PSEU
MPETPKFASTSGSVKFEGKTKPKDERTSEVESGHTTELRTTEPWGWGGTTQPADKSPYAFGQNSGYAARDLVALSSRDPAKLLQSGELHSEDAARMPISDKIIHNEETVTRALLSGLEFRVIARETGGAFQFGEPKVGGRSVGFHDAFVSRLWDDDATARTGHAISRTSSRPPRTSPPRARSGPRRTRPSRRPGGRRLRRPQPHRRDRGGRQGAGGRVPRPVRIFEGQAHLGPADPGRARARRAHPRGRPPQRAAGRAGPRRAGRRLRGEVPAAPDPPRLGRGRPAQRLGRGHQLRAAELLAPARPALPRIPEEIELSDLAPNRTRGGDDLSGPPADTTTPPGENSGRRGGGANRGDDANPGEESNRGEDSNRTEDSNRSTDGTTRDGEAPPRRGRDRSGTQDSFDFANDPDAQQWRRMMGVLDRDVTAHDAARALGTLDEVGPLGEVELDSLPPARSTDSDAPPATEQAPESSRQAPERRLQMGGDPVAPHRAMVDALNESAAQHSRSGREPEPRTELLGPDVFGRRAPNRPPTSSPGTTTPTCPRTASSACSGRSTWRARRAGRRTPRWRPTR